MPTMLDDAVLFANKAHFGQRWNGTHLPNFAHCVDVMNLVSLVEPRNETVLAAAVLHETLEKTKTTPQEIALLFGGDVLRIVLTLSNLDAQTGSARSDLARKRLAEAPADVQTVKLADLISTTPKALMADRNAAITYLADKAALLSLMNKGNGTLHNQAAQLLNSSKTQLGIAA